tara:strand:- start:398 stop:1525 length:1128 start_codon:yes stop_codon:yes gene_type:complete
MCVKLKTGIMQSSKVFFNRLMGGIRFEFTLNTAANSFKLFRNAVDTANNYVPQLSHINANAKYTGYPLADSPATAVYLSWMNNQMIDVDRCPFCVGEQLSITGMTNKSNITSIDIATVGGEKFIKLSVASWISNAIGDIPSGANVFSTSMDTNTKNPTFKVSNVEMIMEEITVVKEYQSAINNALKENGKVAYNCVCAQNYRHSVTQSDISSTVHLNLNNSMAKSILVVPTTNNTATIAVNMKQFDGGRNSISGVWDDLDNYQWSYDSKLQPDRPVTTKKTQDQVEDIYDGQYLAEIEKALSLGAIPPLSYLHIKKNAVIGRCLAMENQVYNARMKDFQLNLNYGGGQTQAKLLQCWVVHVRRFEVSSSGVEVIF